MEEGCDIMIGKSDGTVNRHKTSDFLTLNKSLTVNTDYRKYK